jgi:geranylgeranyl pyrophosphate synthase
MLAMQQAAGNDRRRLLALLTGKQIANEEKIRQSLDIYQRLQVRRQAEERIAEYFGKAAAALEAVSVAPERKSHVRQFTDSFMERKK